ncbi:MAG: histidine kinase [Flavobacteriales bacterium]|nr:histidine kinase [Flavobacteriales bacterium]
MFRRIPLKVIYWATQVLGWGLCMGVLVWWNHLNGNINEGISLAIATEAGLGILASHLMRLHILRKGWLALDIASLLPRLVLAAVLFGSLALVIQVPLHVLVYASLAPILGATVTSLFGKFLGWTMLLFAWAVAYMAFHYFSRARREEIRILRLETANRENQLSNLRRQLNPHFMFNALNGIRALVDEDPARAKQAITQLSAILRNSMMTVKRDTVPLGEELDIVRAYLDLEMMRFEERLRVHFDVEPGLERDPVPPMMLQTLAENAVRHGIAHLTAGGEVVIAARHNESHLLLTVKNSGKLNSNKGRSEGTGIGLQNTAQRLRMLFGDHAFLKIREQDGHVITEVGIPLDHPTFSKQAAATIQDH